MYRCSLRLAIQGEEGNTCHYCEFHQIIFHGLYFGFCTGFMLRTFTKRP